MFDTKPAYGAAARQPLALLVLAAAIFTGVTVGLWLLPLGLLVYGAMVFLAARDPQLRTPEVQVKRPRLSSPTFRAQLDAIERTEQEIRRSVAQANGPLTRLLLPVSDQARDLVEQAFVLCAKGQIIEQYLPTIDRRASQKRIAEIDSQLATTNDPYTLDQLQETRQALLEKQGHARDLETYVGRIVAQLQNIAASLDNVLAETVRLRTADVVSADAATNQVAQRLNDLKSDMDAFQHVLDGALSQSGVPA